ncbi:CBU_0592 family membrane protein [Leeuwenhoekiella nanhaiensis]|uniref:CBU-0592-like domain-containing protein n=1 Tax=Leeuwenhoekiella nanhaiensis TaxID=1655491 RepID=A0A2G1VR12_9FLAO|nr:hypothetical protein [Leeuwenhoekiella nanhaiensis]PHQ28889.1 hypothetical protein CJ305_11890 [Leeuwenhoekiella nanhaiensis]
MNLTDWIGALGTFQILLAYILQVTNVLKKNSLIFILLNTIGAGMACTASVLLNYVPFIFLEAVWTLVSLGALVVYFRDRKTEQEQ